MTPDASRASALTAAALEYAAIGWASFPITSSKTPLAGSHGYRDASTDAATLRRMFSHPDARGLAIATDASGLVCMDIDPRNGGTVTAARVLTGKMPDHPIKTTPRGGVHHVFRGPVCSKIATRANAIGPGIDVEASGSGVMFCPPTTGYAWAVSPLEIKGAAILPLWLWKLLPKVEPRPMHSPRRAGAGRALRFSLDDVLRAIRSVKRTRDGWIGICPAHDDRHRSLSIRAGNDGKPVLWCFACCYQGDGGAGFHRVAVAIEQLVGVRRFA